MQFPNPDKTFNGFFYLLTSELICVVVFLSELVCVVVVVFLLLFFYFLLLLLFFFLHLMAFVTLQTGLMQQLCTTIFIEFTCLMPHPSHVCGVCTCIVQHLAMAGDIQQEL